MFVSNQEHYSICFPSWWITTEPQLGQVLFVSPRYFTNVTGKHVSKVIIRVTSTQFCENISVIVEKLANNEYDLKKYTVSALEQLAR